MMSPSGLLWIPDDTAQWIEQARYDEMLRANLDAETAWKLQRRTTWELQENESPFGLKRAHMLYLIATGCADQAGQVAKELATEAYDEKLDRHICEHTGNVYFHACEPDEYWDY